MAVSRTSADHVTHDELLLAMLASGDDVSAQEMAQAEVRLRDCAECALLLADLRAIRAATADLPAPPRRRDYRLTHEDVLRLRPSRWRRFVEAFGSSRDRVTAPAAAGLATLGIAGLLLVSTGQLGSGVNVAGNATSALDGAPAASVYTTQSGAAPDSAGGAAPTAGGGAAPEAAGAAPGTDQTTIRAGEGAAAASPATGSKLAPVAPGATGGPAAIAQPAEGAGDASSSAPSATEGPAMLALPVPSGAASGASAPPQAAQVAPPQATPAATAAPAPAPASEQGPSSVAVIVLLSLVAIAASVVLAAFRVIGRRLASEDRR